MPSPGGWIMKVSGGRNPCVTLEETLKQRVYTLDLRETRPTWGWEAVRLSSFWQGFFLILIFLPLAFFWGFAIVDLFTRKDLSGWTIALWLLAIIILPVFGVLLYFIFRPVTARDVAAAQAYQEEYEFNKAASATDRLHKLSELRDKGDITQEEFEKQKAKLLKE